MVLKIPLFYSKEGITLENSIYVVVFESTHYAIAAEKLFKELKLPVEIIPTPREITASCGLSIKFNEGLLESVQKALDSGNILIKGVYQMMRINNQRVVSQIV